MLELPRVSVIVIDTLNYGKAYSAIQKTLQQINPAKVLFFTDVDLVLDPKVEIVKIKKIRSKDEYSHFLLKEAWKHIDTEFVLVQQHDSWVLDAEQFDERLYQCDYAGSLWLETDGLANGNGGFSWRSKRLMATVGQDEFVNVTLPEDVSLCRIYRRYLEKTHGLVWASDEICDQFAFELRTPIRKTFGFHSFFHKPYQKTVVIKRTGATGDVVQVEPVLHHFWMNGYRVVLDTLPQFHQIFMNHYFKVHRLDELDQRLLETAEIYNLDGAYEATPKQLHLKSYYNFCGVTDGIIRNPKLSIGFDAKDKQYKMFEKLAVIHYDRRGQNGRNIFGVNWTAIVKTLKSQGYFVVQIGKGEHEKIDGAIEMNLTNENLLCYLLACADLFIGCDSGPSNIAVAFNVPSIIFFGAVESSYIYADLSNICVIDTGHVCELPKCWSEVPGGTEGMKCIVDEKLPPCVDYDLNFGQEVLMQKIKFFISIQKHADSFR